MVAASLSMRTMGQALVGAGTTTRTGRPLSSSQITRILERLGLATAIRGQ